MFICHANEDKDAVVEPMVAALEERGLRVWLDRMEILIGDSLAQKIDEGLIHSRFGMVVVSRAVLAKETGWVRRELDTLAAREAQEGQVVVLPVWHGVGYEDVFAYSPTLAGKLAAKMEDGPDAVAEMVLRRCRPLTVAAETSPAKRLKRQITTGFPWSRPPRIMAASCRVYDHAFGDDYALTELVHYPEGPHKPLGDLAEAVDLVRSHAIWDGRRATVGGHQLPGMTQVFDELVRAEEMPAVPGLLPGTGVVAYVFQLRSVSFTQGEICYVHCIGPYDRRKPTMWPHPPDPTWLCWVTGLLMAVGWMPNTRGKVVSAMYVAASGIWFTPEIDGFGASGGPTRTT